MEKQTVFIKRLPSKGELPKEDNKDYCSNIGMVYFRKLKFYFRDEQLITFTDKVEWYLEEIELPSEEDLPLNVALHHNTIYHNVNLQIAWDKGVKMCYNFILNKLKKD